MEALHFRNTTFRSELLARELELDRRVLNDPRVQAQKVQVELIKQLQEQAPWLIPQVI